MKSRVLENFIGNTIQNRFERRKNLKLESPVSRLLVFPGGLVAKSLPASARDSGDVGLIPGSGRFTEGGNGNLPQYSCLENPMDRGAQWASVHEFTVRHNWVTEHTSY